MQRALDNTCVADVKKDPAGGSDLQVYGDGNAWQLIAKWSSKKLARMISIKKLHGTDAYQFTARESNADGFDVSVSDCVVAACCRLTPTALPCRGGAHPGPALIADCDDLTQTTKAGSEVETWCISRAFSAKLGFEKRSDVVQIDKSRSFLVTTAREYSRNRNMWVVSIAAMADDYC